METLIIVVIVGVALLYVVKRVWSTLSAQGKSTCACGCSGCAEASKCEEADNKSRT